MSYTWGSFATDATINNVSVTASGGTQTSATYSNTGLAATEFGLIFTYGATTTTGLVVTVERTYDGTNFEAVADGPWQFTMPFAASTTYHRVWTVPATVAQFRVVLSNANGSNVTAATLRVRTATN